MSERNVTKTGVTPLVPGEGKCMDCGKQFKNKRGLAIHARSAHPDIYHARCATEIVEVERSHRKSRWDPEESAVLAREESKLVRRGCYAINQAFVGLTSGRTREAIKSHRKLPEYKQMVRPYLKTTGGLFVNEAVVPARRLTRVTSGTAPGPQDDGRPGDGRSSPEATRVAEGRPPGPQPTTLASTDGPSGPIGVTRTDTRSMRQSRVINLTCMVTCKRLI